MAATLALVVGLALVIAGGISLMQKETLRFVAAKAIVRFQDGTLSEGHYERGDVGGESCLGALDDFTDGRRDIPHRK